MTIIGGLGGVAAHVLTDSEAWGLRVYFGTLSFVFLWSLMALWDRWRASRHE